MLSRRSRTLCLKSSSVHWSCVPPPEPPAGAERPSLLSLHVAIPPSGASGFHWAKDVPLGKRKYSLLLGGSIPAALFTEVCLEHGSAKLDFRFTEFSEVRSKGGSAPVLQTLLAEGRLLSLRVDALPSRHPLRV